MGQLLPQDRWCSNALCVSTDRHVQALKLQGFDRLLVPDEEDAVSQSLQASLRAEGVEVVSGQGDNAGDGEVPRFVSMLGEVLEEAEEDEAAAAEEEQEEG